MARYCVLARLRPPTPGSSAPAAKETRVLCEPPRRAKGALAGRGGACGDGTACCAPGKAGIRRAEGRRRWGRTESANEVRAGPRCEVDAEIATSCAQEGGEEQRE